MYRAGTARINACGIVRLLTTMKQEAPPLVGGVVHGTIVGIDDVGITLNGTNGTFKVDHKFIALYWVPYRMVDAAGKSLNVGDKVYYSDSKGELIKGEIESILGWGYNSRTSTAGIQFKLINIEYPEHYKRQEYKTRTVVAGSTVIKVN